MSDPILPLALGGLLVAILFIISAIRDIVAHQTGDEDNPTTTQRSMRWAKQGEKDCIRLASAA
jgi:hypothetical protein